MGILIFIGIFVVLFFTVAFIAFVLRDKTGETVSFGKGDLVTFPQGLSCTWQVKKNVRKHYKFGP